MKVPKNLRTVYRCPFENRSPCPKVARFADVDAVFQFAGCMVGPLAARTGEDVQTICLLEIDPDVIQSPADLRDIVSRLILQCDPETEAAP